MFQLSKDSKTPGDFNFNQDNMMLERKIFVNLLIQLFHFSQGKPLRLSRQMRKQDFPTFKARQFASNHWITLSNRAIIFEQRSD